MAIHNQVLTSTSSTHLITAGENNHNLAVTSFFLLSSQSWKNPCHSTSSVKLIKQRFFLSQAVEMIRKRPTIEKMSSAKWGWRNSFPNC